MSKEVMAECLEEAINVWAVAVSRVHQEYDLSDSGALATIAVALYQERMRHVEAKSHVSATSYADGFAGY